MSSNMSANLLTTKTVDGMADDEAEHAAETFDRLVAHGKGFAVLDSQEFESLLLALAKDEKGAKLLQLLLSRRGKPVET